ncbi:hypothetical protein VZT92_001135 [Zoarces viviparus]|uniref:Uncharacterized protein n=1 Tax=Zoarces viviparus TaxID=48416 RepID=A0AAW1G308_ZOAVI
MAAVASLVTQGPLECTSQRSCKFMCSSVPGLSSAQQQSTDPDNKTTQCHHMTEGSVTDREKSLLEAINSK